MILITSAAYVNPSLASEFGQLPPCMLPVQNKRLYMHQISLCATLEEQVWISLPSSYNLSEHDKNQLAQCNAIPIMVPDGLSLGQSVVYCLNSIGRFDEPLHILHGDTLFKELPHTTDCYLVAKAADNYAWASVDQETIYAGFFSFSEPSLLIRCVTENNNDFIAGIESYDSQKPLSRVESNSWMDFGLVNTYYRSISNLTTERAFNDLNIGRFSLRKSSHDINKILAEANWIQSLPKSLRHYAPAVWDSGIENGQGFYEMEYCYLSSLANLFVFCSHPRFVWNDILNACQIFITDIAQYRPKSKTDISQIARNNNNHFTSKTIKRLERFSIENSISLDTKLTFNGIETPSLRQISEETGEMIGSDKCDFVTLMHGDFCFSNILYVFKSKSIKDIDPRGIDNNGSFSLYGDIRYDVAKLAHSVLGLYDFIIAGIFDYDELSPYEIKLQFNLPASVLNIQELFKSMHFDGSDISSLNVYPIMVQLFLSMLPLHNDNPQRQKAMLANALRLYIELKSN